jgi:porin
VVVAAILTALLLELHGVHRVYAQTVDVEQALAEDYAPQHPVLSVRPWLWTREKLLHTTSRIKDLTGLSLGMQYVTMFQIAPEAPTPHYTWVGTFDFYGTWNLVHSAALGDGSLGFVFRNRNVWAPLTGTELSNDVGLPWGINNSGSEAYMRPDQIWWQQSMFDNTLVIQGGKLDPTTYFNSNRVASSDGEDFLMQSLSYSQTIAFPSAGMGFNFRYRPDPRLYIDAGMGDANGTPDKPNGSFTSFAEGHYFEAFEIGFTPDMKTVSDALGEGHYRLGGWHSAQATNQRSGSGFALSADQELPNKIVPFLRFGYCPAGAGRTSLEVDWGVVSVAPFERPNDRLGFGATWANPTAPSTSDQFAFELFYRLQVVDGVQVTPDVEFIVNPVLNPGSSFQPVFGLRVRSYL